MEDLSSGLGGRGRYPEKRMQFRISHLLVATTAVAAIVAAWVVETSDVVRIDAGYEMPVTLIWDPEVEASVSYALIDRATLDDVMDKCQIWRDHETGDLHPPDQQLPKLPEFTPLNAAPARISIPFIKMKSPLLRRELGSSKPYDCALFWIKHEFGTSYIMVYESDWGPEKSFSINVDEQIETGKKPTDSINQLADQFPDAG